MDAEEEASLFAYSYYVQSPSTVSHANSTECHNQDLSLSLSLSVYQSPPPPNSFSKTSPFDASGISLSRCGSNRSFIVHHKKISYDDLRSQGTGDEIMIINGRDHRVIVHDHKAVTDHNQQDDEEEEEVWSDEGGWRKYLSFRTHPSSSAWIGVQLCWRFLFSLAAALLVFYVATKPLPPHVSVKVERIHEFELGEGVDATGVATNIMTLNCSMEVVIDNKSKVFGLHILPPIVDMAFGHFIFARTHGEDVVVSSHQSTPFKLYVAVANKAMYGAGRSMEDMLESGKGLPLTVRLAFTSTYYVVGSLINPKFHHQAQCLLVLQNVFDKKHITQAFSSTCNVYSS